VSTTRGQGPILQEYQNEDLVYTKILNVFDG